MEYSNNDFRNYELYHHGILGQKWGVRRYQNADGTLTEAGKKRAKDGWTIKEQGDYWKAYDRAKRTLPLTKAHKEAKEEFNRQKAIKKQSIKDYNRWYKDTRKRMGNTNKLIEVSVDGQKDPLYKNRRTGELFTKEDKQDIELTMMANKAYKIASIESAIITAGVAFCATQAIRDTLL